MANNKILAEMKKVAKMRRLGTRAAWMGAQMMSAYAMWKSEGFSARKISKVMQRVNEMEGEFDRGELHVKDVRKLMCSEKYGLNITVEECEPTPKNKNAYKDMIEQKMVECHNDITITTDRYILFFLKALIDVECFGRKRINRVKDYVFKLYQMSDSDPTLAHRIQRELLDGTGLMFESPKDWAKGE